MKEHPKDKRALRAAAVQFESLPADKDANFRKIETFVAQAAAQGVRLVIFPECCITGYWFIRNLSVEQLAALAEPSRRPQHAAIESSWRATPGYGWRGIGRNGRGRGISQ